MLALQFYDTIRYDSRV